jgi:uncharacterized protein YbjT (DUF2867 family)
MASNILIVGANGLVGQGVLTAALQDPSVRRLAVLTRRPMPGLDPRVVSHVVEAFTPAHLQGLPLEDIDACLYCAGALPLGMGEAAYRQVTVDLTLSVAQAYARRRPQGRFLYVSGMGADPRSPLMPLRVKGQAEEALHKLDLVCCCLRPGIVQPVQGEHSPHAWRRPAYMMVHPVLSLACKLMPSMFTTTQALGKAMLHLVQADTLAPIVENAAINQLAGQTDA